MPTVVQLRSRGEKPLKKQKSLKWAFICAFSRMQVYAYLTCRTHTRRWNRSQTHEPDAKYVWNMISTHLELFKLETCQTFKLSFYMWCFPLMRKHAPMYVNICANVSTCACGAKAVFLDMQTVLGCNSLLTHPPTLLEHTNSPCEIPVYCTYWLMLTHAVCIYKLWNLITSCKYIVFGSAARPTRLAHFSQGAEPTAPAMQNCTPTQKVLRDRQFFNAFDVQMRFAPQRHVPFQQLNFQKCSENGVFSMLTSKWFEMCFAPQRHTFFQHQLTKVLRTRSDFKILCVAPQPRALFGHPQVLQS